jgi:hypothetical protein
MMFVRVLLVLILSLTTLLSYAENTKHQTRLWSNISWRAPLSDDNQWFYSVESILRFVDKNEKFDLAALEPGLGKEILPGLNLWLGFRIQEENDGHNLLQTLIIPWEALMWDMVSNSYFTASNRFRVEERKSFSHSDLAVRVREKINLAIPIMKSEHYYCDFYDEIILNAANTDWDGNKLVNQNRSYAGLRYQFNKKTGLSLGYLFTYRYRNPDEASNIIYLRLILER